MNSVLLLVLFCGQNDLMQMRFTLRWVQCMVTSVLRYQQYKFGVRSLLAAEIHIRYRGAISGLDSSQHHSLRRAFRSLLTDGTCLNEHWWYVEK